MKNRKILSMLIIAIFIIIVFIIFFSVEKEKNIATNVNEEVNVYKNEITGEYIIYDNSGMEITRTTNSEKIDLLIDNPNYNPKK